MRRFLALFTTLRGRLVLLVCFATLPALLFTFYAASNERSAVLQRTEKEALLLAQLASREHAHQMEGAKALLQRLGRVLADDLPGPPRDACPEFFPALLAGYPQFTTIGILATDGSLSCSAYPAPAAVNMKENPAFVRALASREVEVGDYTIGPIVGRPVIHMAYALRDGAGAVRRVVFVGLDLQWLTRLAEQAALPAEYSLVIADAHGRILAHSGAQLGSAKDGASPISGFAELAAQRKALVLNVENLGPRFFVGAPLRGIAGVSVIAGLPYDRVYGEANRVFYRTALGLSLLTLLTIGCALVAAELSVLRVLRLLSRTARLFGAGDLSARAAVSAGRGELTELTGAFNSMAEALEARQREAAETQAQLRALSRRLVLAREEEAGRIARELHDELGQVLTSVKVDLANLKQGRAPGGGGLEASVAELSERIDGAVSFVRRVSSDLRPAVLDRLGLTAALEWLVRDQEARTSLAVVLEIDRVEEPVDGLVSITLFRIVQEALTNIIRHANATEVGIDLRGGDGFLLTVRDNGKGIDPAAAGDARSLGILGMKERALLVGGELRIEGRAGEGTTIVVRIPNPQPGEHDVAHPSR